jgi:hypothetical protein
MNEFSNETSGQEARTRARLGRHLHHRHHHQRFAGCGSEARRDAGRRERGERGERMNAVREFHRALANVARSGNEQLRGEAAQIVAEATSRLNGLLGAER